MPKRVAATFASLAALVALTAGCGESGLSADEYASEVDAVCTDASEFLQTLPQRAQEEGLDQAAIGELANEKADEAEAALEELDPPDELADAHERLLSLGTEEPPDVTDPAIVGYFEEFRDVYAELGAEECVAIQEDSIEQLREVQDDVQSP